MKRMPLVPIFMALLMVSSAALAVVLKPEQRLVDELPPLSLEEAVPKSFGDWRVDDSIVPIDPSPDVQASLNEIYSQLLARTYINSDGERIMLSIAYGSDQSGDGSQVHRPEFCYTAQGFQVMANNVGSLVTQYGTLPVRRLLAVQGRRSEPITYWVTVGDKATLPGIERKMSQLAYGLTGKIPDGMLVRVSTISKQNEAAYQLQEKFIRDMLQNMNTKDRVRVAGKFGA
ncbi:MAG TPA: EpsI family protein [Methylophilaceae bacterium]|nr:EpsI family protein [Methylophilaceae bacterium]